MKEQLSNFQDIINHYKANPKGTKTSYLKCRNLECNQNKVKRIYIHAFEDRNAIKRTYKCQVCGSKFSTFESFYTHVEVMIVDKLGNRSKFNKQTLITSMNNSLKDCFISKERIERIVDGVEDVCVHQAKQNQKQVVIHADSIYKLVESSLRELNWTGYCRYVLLHKKFATQNEFIEYITKKKEPTKE